MSTSLQLDHLAVAGETLDAAVAHVQDALRVTMGPGGEHRHFATHNRLIGLEDGLYLEAIAIDPAQPVPGVRRWFDLDRFRGPARLSNWICRVDDLDAALALLPKRAGVPVALSRGAFHWKMAVPEDGQLPCNGVFPALIQWQSAHLPAHSLPSCGLRLTRLELAHPQADWLRGILPIRDPRVELVSGEMAMQAHFEGPRGRRVLR